MVSFDEGRACICDVLSWKGQEQSIVDPQFYVMRTSKILPWHTPGDSTILDLVISNLFSYSCQ